MKIIGTTLNAKYIHTNLALRLLKSYAAPEFNLQILEFTIKDPLLHIVTELFKQDADVIGFSCYIWNVEEIKQIATLLKKVQPNVKMILGGPEATFQAVKLLEEIPAIDAIVIGEGEATFKELLTAIEMNTSLATVTGIAYRTLEGKVVVNSAREKLPLTAVGSAYRFPEDVANLPKRITYFETSRGCPFSCAFCLSSTESGVRFFDLEQTKADLLFLIENGAKTIKFMDRTFNVRKDYALILFDFLIEHHRPGMSIQFEITADILDPKVVEYLNEHAPAGLFRFEIGVQSTNERTNMLCGRRQNFAKLAHVVQLIKSGGKMEQHLDLIAGLPEEDYPSFRKTFNDVFALRPEELQLGFLKMLHGTPLTREAAKWGYQFMDKPPYEILSNHVLSFHDVVRIKQVEDVLEKYWNSQRMPLGMEYLVSNVFETPFDFFQAFGTFWEEQGWARIGHQLEDLFRRLLQFIQLSKPKAEAVLSDLLKVDYLRALTYKPRSVWWSEGLTKQERSAYYEQILDNPSLVSESFAQLQLTEKDLFKHCLLEPLSIDWERFESTKVIAASKQYLLVYFHPKTHEAWLFQFTPNQ